MTGKSAMTRDQILTVLNDHLTTHYPPDVVSRIQSIIDGTLSELDALPPYPSESDFQTQLSVAVYPFLAAAQGLDMEGEDCSVLKELIEEMFPQPAGQLL